MCVFAYAQIPHDSDVNSYTLAIVVYWNEPKSKDTFQPTGKHITSFRIFLYHTVSPEVSTF